MKADTADYHRQLTAQIAQYADVDDMHDGSPAAHWLNGRFLASRLREVFGADSIVEIYARGMAEAVRRCGIAEVVSLGSGYGALEIRIAAWARDHGLPAFRITCLEVSPLLVGRARDAIRAAGLQQWLGAEIADLNQPMPLARPVAAFMAHHSLHHLVELEALFDQIAELLHPEGVFIAIDMIGRNGHMRWPETLAIVRQIWPLLPQRLKWDRSFQRLDCWYENWDCSIEGFEGIRAQDILPALIQRKFGFERFVATGGLTDVFYDRRFGANFVLDNRLDVAFLEALQALEDRLIEAGQITPVCLYAVMRSPRSQFCPPRPICYRGVTPTLALRQTDGAWPRMAPTWQALEFTNPYLVVAAPAPTLVHRGRPLRFGSDGNGRPLARWGWGVPERDFTWSLGIEAALEFTVAESVSALALSWIAYVPPAHAEHTLRVLVNGVEQDRFDLSRRHRDGCVVQLRERLHPGATAVLEFVLSRPRRPDEDGGDDRRPLGIALISLTLLG